MNKTLTLTALAAILLTAAACTKPDTTTAPAPTPGPGPMLNPPANDDDTELGPADPPPVTAPTEPAPPAEQGTSIGSPAPVWTNLEGIDGKMHSLNDLADAKAVAVVFTCNHCPVAQAYEDRLVKFANDYKAKGVELVAISVSDMEEDKLPAMKERAKEKGFEFAYLYDPSQEIGKAFGAAVTPHAFVLDRTRKIVYMGAIDDNQDESAVQKHGMRDAVDAVLAGKMPEATTLKPHGCSINYD